MSDVAAIRYRNTQRLLDEFARSRSGFEELRGIETQFASHLGITKNYWSALKTGKRQIGTILARQFEARCGKPQHWLDAERPVNARLGPSTDDEWLIVSLVLTAYRTAPEATRDAVLGMVEKALSATAFAPALPAANKSE